MGIYILQVQKQFSTSYWMMVISVISSTKETYHIDVCVCVRVLKKLIRVKISLSIWKFACQSIVYYLKIIFKTNSACVLNSLIFSSFATWVIPCLSIFTCNMVCESLQTFFGGETIIFSTTQFSVSGFLMVLMSDFWLLSKHNMLC